MVDKTEDSRSKRSSALNSTGSIESDTKSTKRISSYVQSIAQISGVVTIIVATVYALGVFTLVLPIANTYNTTVPAASYAVSVVPKTVVVGHGIKSLVWPSLALTLATTLFALTMLWGLHTLAIGWRHARAEAGRQAQSLYSMVRIYAFLCVLTLAIFLVGSIAVIGQKATFSTYNVAPITLGIGTYVQFVVLRLLSIFAAALCVLSYSAAAVFVVARSLRGMRWLITSRTFPSISLRGLIYKGLAFAVISSVFLGSAYLLSTLILYPTTVEPRGSLPDRLLIGTVFSWAIVGLFGLAAALYLMVRLLRYTRKAHLIGEARRSNFTPIFAPLRDMSTSLAQRAKMILPTLLYSMVLFLVLFLVVFVAYNTLTFLVSPLVGEVRGEIKSETWLDEGFIPLVVFAALVSGAIMYQKDWKDLGGDVDHLLARGSSRHFFIGLLKSIGARSFRRGLLLSLAVAYVIALAWAFLLAGLISPPLPEVEVNKLPQPESSQAGQEPDFQGKTLGLLAHTEGYWYLISENDGDLLVVPDRPDKFVRLRLDEQSTGHQAVGGKGDIFRDEFADTSGGWETYEGGGKDPHAVEYASSGLRLYDPLPGDGLLNPLNLDAGTAIEDAILEVDATVRGKAPEKKDTAWGLICRAVDYNHYYMLGITAERRPIIWKRKDNRWAKLATGRPSDAARGGTATNRLRADCLGSELTLYANGQRVLKAEDSELKSGRIGLHSQQFGEDLDVVFDNFLASSP